MSGWQRAGDIPGLVPADRPAVDPHPAAAAGAPAAMRRAAVDRLPIWSCSGAACVRDRHLLVISGPWRDLVLSAGSSRRARAGRPNSLHGQPIDIWYVFIAIGVLTIGVGRSHYGAQSIYRFVDGSTGFSEMVRREPCVQRQPSDQLLGRLGPISYSILTISVITIIGWAGFTAWMRWFAEIQGTRREVSSSAPDWKFCGVHRGARMLLHHPDSVGVSVDVAVDASQTVLADRHATRGDAYALTCAGAPSLPAPPTATSVPSGLKIMPRVSPRPSCALGESCA
jgi:hypothetical protein